MGYVARVEDRRVSWLGNLSERDHLEDIAIVCKITIKLILKTLNGDMGRGNEPSDSIKCGEFLE